MKGINYITSSLLSLTRFTAEAEGRVVVRNVRGPDRLAGQEDKLSPRHEIIALPQIIRRYEDRKPLQKGRGPLYLVV